MAPGPSCRRPRSPTPSPWTDSTPSPASARGGVWCGSTRALLSPAARGSRLVCPLAAWAQAPRQRRASVLAPPARRAARRLSRGPSPQRRDGASAPTLRATSLWPAERTHTARARRGRSGRLSGPGHALTGCHGRGVRARPLAPACREGRRRACRRTGSRWAPPGNRARPCGPPGVDARLCAQRPWALTRRGCLAAGSRACMGSARPCWVPWAAPHPPLRLTGARRGAAPRVRRTVGGDRDVSRAQSTLPTRAVAAILMAGDPQAGCGAVTLVHQQTAMQTEHVARGGLRLACNTAEKNWKNPL